MINKRILVIEDVCELQLIEELFNRHSKKGEYELTTIPDLSDEGVYQRHLPEDYDVYWLHSSAVEFEAINEIREKQPWSKIVVRTAEKEKEVVRSYLRNNGIDKVISQKDGSNKKLIVEILKEVGVYLELSGGEK